MEEDILTTSAIVIIYPDGQILTIPKMPNLDYHIQYINYEINNNDNICLRAILKECDLEIILSNPSNLFPVINEITKNGSIILTNLACNYMGKTNCFAAYLPAEISLEQDFKINELEILLKTLEYMNIGKYDPIQKRVKGIESTDFIKIVKNSRIK